MNEALLALFAFLAAGLLFALALGWRWLSLVADNRGSTGFCRVVGHHWGPWERLDQTYTYVCVCETCGSMSSRSILDKDSL